MMVDRRGEPSGLGREPTETPVSPFGRGRDGKPIQGCDPAIDFERFRVACHFGASNGMIPPELRSTGYFDIESTARKVINTLPEKLAKTGVVHVTLTLLREALRDTIWEGRERFVFDALVNEDDPSRPRATF